MENATGGVQSVLVLGGGSDIGLATARRLVERGARSVVLAARRPAELEPGAAELRAMGATVETVAFDATDAGSHGALIDGVFDRLGDVDVVIAAFGVLGDETEFEANPVAAAGAIAANYVGAVSTGLAAARRLAAQGHGVFVLLSSVAGQRPRRDNFVYGSSKAGADFFARGLAAALDGSGARVLVVRPGFVRTKMTAGMKAAPFAVDADAVAAATVDGIEQHRTVVWAPSIMRWLLLVLNRVPEPLFRQIVRRARG